MFYFETMFCVSKKLYQIPRLDFYLKIHVLSCVKFFISKTIRQAFWVEFRKFRHSRLHPSLLKRQTEIFPIKVSLENPKFHTKMSKCAPFAYTIGTNHKFILIVFWMIFHYKNFFYPLYFCNLNFPLRKKIFRKKNWKNDYRKNQKNQ